MLVPVTELGPGLRVEWVDFYGDFTMTVGLVDGAGRQTQVCFDGRVKSPTRCRLFHQGRHPRQTGAVLVELGSPEEGVVVPLVSRYLDSGGPKASGLTEYGWELARETLLRLGEPPGYDARNTPAKAQASQEGSQGDASRRTPGHQRPRADLP